MERFWSCSKHIINAADPIRFTMGILLPIRPVQSSIILLQQHRFLAQRWKNVYTPTLKNLQQSTCYNQQACIATVWIQTQKAES
jgi:hypothetical protein